MKRKNSFVGKLMLVILLTAALGMIAGGVYLVFFKNMDAYERQQEEQDLADTYVDDLILKLRDPQAWQKKVEEEARKREERLAALKAQASEQIEETEETEQAEEENEPAETEGYTLPYEEYTDDNYYSRDGVIYTPDKAKGVIDCVLEVPTAGIRRGVYTGTWEEIIYNLDIWMVTASRPDYRLGETHYCIYGHNHTAQDLSFNKLQKVQVGEYFYLTAESGRYTYEITNVFAVSREAAAADYVDNFSIGSDKCYIITCGRNDGVRNFRYLDLIVEGTLREHLTIEEYAELLGK